MSSSDESDSEENILAKKKQLEEKLLLTEKKLARIHERKKCSTNANQRKNSDQNADSSLPSLAKEDEFDSNTFLEEFACMDFDEDEDENSTSFDEENNSRFVNKQKKKAEKLARISSNLQLGSNEMEEYTRTRSQCSISGPMYEVKVLALLYLRATIEGWDFRLGTSIQGARKFDDVGLAYMTESGRRQMLVQLKHKESRPISKARLLADDSRKQSFSLLKYYKSFCTLKKEFGSNTVLNRHSQFRDIHFVLCTNATAIPSEGLFTDQDLVTTHSILNTDGKIFRFAENNNFIQEFKDRYSSDIDDDIVKEFFDQFYIYSNQTSERNLDIHIEEEIKTVYGISTYGAKKIRDRLVKEIQAWWGDRTQNHPLKRDEVKFTSDWENLHKFNDGPPKLEFKPEALTSIKDILSSEAKMINCVIDVDKCGPSRDKLTQFIRETSVKCLTVTLEDVEKHQESILYTWPSRQCPILVITYESRMQINKNNIEKFSVIFKQALDLEKGSKLFLISKQGELGKLLFGEEFKSSLKEMNITCEIKSITNECHERILQKIINFQGSCVTVELVLGKDCGDAIDAQMFSLLTHGDGIPQLGHIIQEKQTCYIDRVLTCSSYVKRSILHCNSRDAFAISGVTDEEMDTFLGMPENDINAPASYPIGYLSWEISFQFKNMSQWYYDGTVIDSTLTASYYTLRNLFAVANKSTYSQKQNNNQSSNSIEINSDVVYNRKSFYIIRSSEEYAKLCKEHNHKNIHWLTVENGKLKWKESTGNFNTIQRYLLEQKEPFPVNNVWDISNRIVVVIGDSGMGKSTLLNKMAANSKRMRPETCIIWINLRDCVSELENLAQTITPRAAQEFIIRNSMSFRESNERSVSIFLEYILKCTDRGVVFVDGFDEVCPENECKVVNLIRSFMKLRISKIWITSRRNMASRLERITKTISFELQPLKMSESTELINQHMHDKKHGTIREFKITPDVIACRLLENPLHCEMIAEVQMYTDKKNKILGNALYNKSVISALVMLEAIVETKFEISCKKYLQFTSENMQTRELIDVRRKNCIENHEWSALLHIWSFLKIRATKLVNEKKLRQRVEEFINAVKVGVEVTGIITTVRGGIPQFEHHIYAEYFLALWMKENCRGLYRDVTSMLLRRIIFDPRFSFVIKLFNLMTAKDLVLQTTILENDWFLAFPKILELKIVPEVNEKDVAGRTALHFALSLWNTNRENNLLLFLTDKQKKAIGALLRLGAKLDIQDDVLKWSPFRYSNIKTVPWSIVAIMMKNNGILNADMRELIERVQTQKQDALAGLAHGVSFGNKMLVSFLIDNGVCVNDSIDEMGDTALIIAAAVGQYDMLQHLHSEYLAKPELRNRNGDSPLHWACLNGHFSIVKYLINKCKISVDVKNNCDYTPLLAAARGGHLEIFQYLRETRGSDPQGKNIFGQSALCLASGCVDGHLNLVKYLVEKCGLNPNEYDMSGWLPIHTACVAGNVSIIHFFIDKCNIHPLVKTKNGICTLQIIIITFHVEQVKEFVRRYKLSLDITDCVGNTLLMWALFNPQRDKCEYLRRNCTNVTDLNTEGSSALHVYIINCGSTVIVDCIEWLVEKCQINPNIENCNGLTALQCAILRYQNPATKNFIQPDVIEYLKTRTGSHSKPTRIYSTDSVSY